MCACVRFLGKVGDNWGKIERQTFDVSNYSKRCIKDVLTRLKLVLKLFRIFLALFGNVHLTVTMCQTT